MSLLRNINVEVTLNEITPPDGYALPANATTTVVLNLANIVDGNGGITVENDRLPDASGPVLPLPSVGVSIPALPSILPSGLPTPPQVSPPSRGPRELARP